MRKPKFSKKFVMTVTFRHLERDIDISLNKTVARIGDLPESESSEILETLSELSQLKNALQRYRKERPDSFEQEKD